MEADGKQVEDSSDSSVWQSTAQLPVFVGFHCCVLFGIKLICLSKQLSTPYCIFRFFVLFFLPTCRLLISLYVALKTLDFVDIVNVEYSPGFSSDIGGFFTHFQFIPCSYFCSLFSHLRLIYESFQHRNTTLKT